MVEGPVHAWMDAWMLEGRACACIDGRLTYACMYGRTMDICMYLSVDQCCEKLGAGEILLNCVDMDGQKDGFDLGLVKVMWYIPGSNIHSTPLLIYQ